MSDQSILQIDTDEELARVMRQLKTLPQQLGAPNVLKNALNSTARKVGMAVYLPVRTLSNLTERACSRLS